MNKISKWIVKKLGGYWEIPTSNNIVIKMPLLKPIKVAGEQDFPPNIEEEAMKIYIASKVGDALLEAGLIKFEEVKEASTYRESVRYRGTVMAIKQEEY